jgi:hypothetical protein
MAKSAVRNSHAAARSKTRLVNVSSPRHRLDADAHLQHDYVGGGGCRIDDARKIRARTCERARDQPGFMGNCLQRTRFHPHSHRHSYDSHLADGEVFPIRQHNLGEPSFAFGVLLLAAAFYLWRRKEVIIASGDPARYIASFSGPVSIFIVGLGLARGAIAVAGLYYQLFAAPPEDRLPERLHPIHGWELPSCLECLDLLGLAQFYSLSR